MEFIINTIAEELKSNIENKVDKQVFEVYKKDAAQKIDDLGKRFGDYKAEALNFPDSKYSMFHVTWTTFKFNRNQLRTVSAYVM